MRAWAAISVARYCFIAPLGANTSSALMRSDGARNSRSLNSPSGALVGGVVAQAATSSENTKHAEALTRRLLPTRLQSQVDVAHSIAAALAVLTRRAGRSVRPAGGSRALAAGV